MKDIDQDLILYSTGDEFRLLTQYDRCEIATGTDAAVLLQTAIDGLTAVGGGEIEVGSGEYPLHRPVSLNRGVAIRGKGTSTRLRVAGEMEAALLVHEQDGVRLRDFVLIAASPGADGSGIDIANSGDCLLVDVHCKDFAQYGFHLQKNAFLCEFRGCRAWNCGEAGFCLRDLKEAGRAGNFVPNFFVGCGSYGGAGAGFVLHNALVINFVGCQVVQSGGHGFHLTRESNSVALTGCRTFQVGGDAYRAEEANEINLTGNVFCWQRGDGIVLRKVTWGAISGNEIIDNGVRTSDGSLRNGIRLLEGCRGLQISGNAIFNWADQCPMQAGIVEDDSCLANNISNNNINYYRTSGLVSKGQDTIAANNTCTGNWFMWDPAKPCPDFKKEPLDRFIRGYPA